MTTSAGPAISYTVKADAGAARAPSRRDAALNVAAGVALAVLYLLFRVRVHNYDAVSYALAADVLGARAFIHQNHLLYVPFNWAVLSLLKLFGYGGEALPVLTATSAITAAAAAVLFSLTLTRLGVSRVGAGLAGAGLAFGAWWWVYAGEAEILSFISFFLAGTLFLLARPGYTNARAAAVGAWLALGTLFHQTLLLFLPVALIVLAGPPGGRGKRLAYFLGAYLLGVGPAYVLIPYLYGGFKFPGQWLTWITSYAATGTWGRNSPWGRPYGAVNLLGALVAGPSCWDLNQRLPWPEVVKRYVPALAVAAFLVATAAAGAKTGFRRHGRWLAACAVWLVGYYAFYAWWEPTNAEWWVAVTIPLWLAFALTAPRRKAMAALTAAVVVALAIWNYRGVITPRLTAPPDGYEAAARRLAGVAAPGDVFIVSEKDLYLWTDYVTRHRGRILRPFEDGSEDKYAKVARVAIRAFPRVIAKGNNVLLTDVEWDAPAIKEPGGARGAAVLFRMTRFARPAYTMRFNGRTAVVYRFGRYAREFEDVTVRNFPGVPDRSGCLLETTGATAGTDFTLARDGEYVLAVQARGYAAAADWPRMEIGVDGRARATVTVNAEWWRFYETPVTLAPGRHTASVTFLNDFCEPKTGANRDLDVARLVVYRRPSSPGDAAVPRGR